MDPLKAKQLTEQCEAFTKTVEYQKMRAAVEESFKRMLDQRVIYRHAKEIVAAVLSDIWKTWGLKYDVKSDGPDKLQLIPLNLRTAVFFLTSQCGDPTLLTDEESTEAAKCGMYEHRIGTITMDDQGVGLVPTKPLEYVTLNIVIDKDGNFQ